MRKSGLHKQISSIFDGVPVPQNSVLSEPTKSSEPTTETEVQPDTEPVVGLQSPPVQSENKSSLVKRLSSDPSECAAAPSIQINRPMPLSKSAIAASKAGPGLSVQVKKALYGLSGGSLDARQKKMAGLVGILSAVFGAVMFVSLGGVGKTQAAAADNSTNASGNTNTTVTKGARDWQNPQPLSADLRDATKPVVKINGSQQTDAAVAQSGDLVVKGIVFSEKKPSAIVNNQILNEGETFKGVRVIKITKDSVEFESNGNRWSQQVQR